jgi:hypothetical protein
MPLYGSSPNSWDSKALTRTIEGITAVLLSLKKKPVIRYEKMSGMAKKLAVEVQVGCFTVMISLLTTRMCFSTEYSQSPAYSISSLPKSLPSC